ncbi:hypothetical protein BD770DRAFT_299442, partial [Pilaira anomala]
ILGAKNIKRTYVLPDDSLLTLFIQQLISTNASFWKKLQAKNEIWKDLVIPLNGSIRQIKNIGYSEMQKAINKYLLQQWHNRQTKFVLARKCRTTIGNDPIMYIPMTNFERSRITRWRMGWL